MPPQSRVADILLEQGRHASDLVRTQGQIWGGLAERLGSLPGEALQEHQRQQQQKQDADARTARLGLDTAHLQMLQGDRARQVKADEQNQLGAATTADLVRQHSSIDPESGHLVIDHDAVVNGLLGKGLQQHAEHYLGFAQNHTKMVNAIENDHLALEAKKNKWRLDTVSAIADAPEDQRASLYATVRGTLTPHAQSDPILGKLPPVYPGHAQLQGIVDALRTDEERHARYQEASAERLKGTHEVPPGGTLVRIDPKTGQTETLAVGGPPAGAAETAKRDAEAERHHRALEGGAAAARAETHRYHLDEIKARVGSGTATGDDAKAIAESIVRGESPPTTTGLFRYAGPVRAELAKQGYDLAHANLDWQATQKHVASLNSTQQTRLRQSINTAADSLDVIDTLAKKWDAGKFPLLNKAQLTLAKGGAFGKEAASIATQLEGQITDVTSELGNVYMGGNSPTDHALQLAGKNLSANWDKKVLLDMTQLARKNLRIRNNSMVNVGVAGAREGNIYAAPPPAADPAAGGRMRVVGPNGQTGTVPAGTALPPGWKKQ